jgi:hypothetical protein
MLVIHDKKKTWQHIPAQADGRDFPTLDFTVSHGI